MTKAITLILFMILPSVAFSFGFQCITHPVSTSFVLEETNENSFKLVVLHHNGLEHAPISDGILTGHSLGVLKDRYNYVQKMGTRFDLEISKENCSHLSKEKTICGVNKKTKIGDLDVESFGLLAFAQETRSAFGVFKSQRVEFSYRIEGYPHRFAMEYYGDCKFKK